MDEQLKMISGRGFDDLSEVDVAAYERRKTQIAELRNELGKLANPD